MGKTTLLKSMLLLCALIVGSTSVWGEQIQSAVPENGKSYVVAAYIGDKYYALPNGAVGGSTIAGVEVSLNRDNKVSTPIAEGKIWTLEEGTGDNAGKFYFKYTDASGTYYLYKSGTAVGNYNFAVNKSNKTFWSFATNGKGYNVEATDRGTTNNVLIQYYNGAFRCYSTETPIILLEVGDAVGQVIIPAISPAGGRKTESQNVTITCDTDDATIYYTTDGNEPTTGSSVYTSAIPVTRTTTIKAKAFKDGLDPSDVATSVYIIVYPEAPLPFAFDGGIGDIENTSGLLQSGLGSDYGSSPKLKFDHQGDYLILRIDNAALPDKLSFDIKGNSLSGTYAFTVQWSADGSDYTDLATYSTIDSKATKEIDISSCIGLKYIKWIYTTKASGNVALGNIRLSQQTEAISTASGKNYATYVTTKALDFSSVSDAIKAYVAASTASEGVITFTGKDAVPAGTPLLIKTTTPGATVNVPLAASTPDAVETNYLVAGDGSNVTYDAGASHFYYILTNGQFKAANNSPVAVGKAYLSLPSAASANELTVNFEDGDGDVTGIKNLTPALSQGEGVAYNLAGQRVNASHKGLVIVNGKKYLNK